MGWNNCYFECGFEGKPVTHHVVPMALCGPDEPWNLIELCPNHHQIIHALASHKEIESLLKEYSEYAFQLAVDDFCRCGMKIDNRHTLECIESFQEYITEWELFMDAHEGRDRGKEVSLGDPEYCCIFMVADILWKRIENYKNPPEKLLKTDPMTVGGAIFSDPACSQ